MEYKAMLHTHISTDRQPVRNIFLLFGPPEAEGSKSNLMGSPKLGRLFLIYGSLGRPDKTNEDL
jgi:hypothetical protein